MAWWFLSLGAGLQLGQAPWRAEPSALLSGGSSGVLAGLFATLERTQPRIRPDGKGFGYLAPANSGELNLAVAPLDRPLSRHLVTRYKQHVRLGLPARRRAGALPPRRRRRRALRARRRGPQLPRS